MTTRCVEGAHLIAGVCSHAGSHFSIAGAAIIAGAAAYFIGACVLACLIAKGTEA